MKQNKNLSGLLILWLIIAVGLIGIIALFAFGVLNTNMIRRPPEKAPLVEVDEQVKNLKQLDSSDEVSAIEKDINATNLNDLDQGIGEIDQALGEL